MSTHETLTSKHQNNLRSAAATRTQRLLIFLILFFALLLGITACSGELKKGENAFAKKDYATALKELTPLAEKGNAKAQTYLGVMYENGYGVTQNHTEAVKWYRKAADQGLAPAQINLGFMYENGQGVTQDYTEAVKWYRRSAEQNHSLAQTAVSVMYAFGKGVPQDFVLGYMWADLAAASGNKIAANLRVKLAKRLTASQIKKAEKLSKECKAHNYKNC